MELLLSVISLALAIYERMERQAEKRRSQFAESEEISARYGHFLWTAHDAGTIGG